jgi:hypothetical protein
VPLPHCFAPFWLFGLLPRAGLERTLRSGAEALRSLQDAEARLELLQNFVIVRAAQKTALAAHVKAMHGSIRRLPLLAVNAEFDLNMVSLSPAVLHDVAQLLTRVKVEF